MSLFNRSFFALLIFALTSLGYADEAKSLRIRIGAANVSSGRHQTYDPGHGIRILQAAKPDVVAIQEMNYGDNSPAAIEKFVHETFGKEFSYYRESHPSKKYSIPNGIVSRYPIQESGSWPDPLMPDRGLAWAKIKLPTGDSLWVISVHLSTKSSTNRLIEGRELVRLIKQNIPENALIAIAGDLNTKSANEDVLKALQAVVREGHAPEGGDGKAATNANRNKRYDWILASPALDVSHIPVDLTSDPGEEKIKGVNTFPSGLVFDTRTMKLLPKPALPEDSAAEGMQHMLVIKDFALPYPTPHKQGPAKNESH